MIGTLVTHCGAVRVTRDGLREIPVPPSTKSWKPVAHAKLVDAIDAELDRRALVIQNEAYAIQRNGALLFGVIDLASRTNEEFAAAIGIRTANDKSFALQLAVGVRVFVCDNLAFAGDCIALRRRHTAGLDLREEIEKAITRYERSLAVLEDGIATLKTTPISNERAKGLVFDVFHQRILPLRLLPQVSTRVLGMAAADPPLTLWRLHNAFTSEVKQLPPAPAFRATVQLGKLFDLGQP
jgi:hypothetical protein